MIEKLGGRMSRYIDLDQIEFLKVDGNKEFNHGVDCCINTLLKQERIAAIPMNKVKQVREELQKCVDMLSDDTIADLNTKTGLGLAIEKIDKLIVESEE